MKRLITLSFLLAVIAVANSQTSSRNRQKVSTQKAPILKPSTEKLPTEKPLKEKSLKEKDTLKKNKIAVEIQEKKIDSLVKVLEVFKPFKKESHASYYADKFNGKKTASGSKCDNNKYTAAHKKLPFGTKVKVTNEKNGKSVVVEITDRGPFVKSREIDLSKRAFMDIASNKGSGGMLVTIEIMSN